MFEHLNLEIWGRWWHYLTSAGSYRGGFTPKHTEKHLLGTLFYPILFWTKICSVVVLYMVIEKIQVSWVKPGRNVNQLAWNPTHLGKNCRYSCKLFDVNTSCSQMLIFPVTLHERMQKIFRFYTIIWVIRITKIIGRRRAPLSISQDDARISPPVPPSSKKGWNKFSSNPYKFHTAR